MPQASVDLFGLVTVAGSSALNVRAAIVYFMRKLVYHWLPELIFYAQILL